MKRIVLLWLLLSTCAVYAQSVTGTISIKLLPVALVDIEPSGNITMAFAAPIEAGNAIVLPATNTTKWLNYTSSISLNAAQRRISVAVNETIPGINIKLQASPAAATGAGAKGLSSGKITVGTTAQTIINNIGGAYTGDGTANGHQLNISMEVTNYTNLKVISNKIIIFTYTISE